MNEQSPDDLGERLRRLATWADEMPSGHQIAAGVYIDRCALGIARLLGEHPDDPLVAELAELDR